METSRNPKVLNRVIIQKLNPVLEKVKDLVDLSNDTKKFIDESKASGAANKQAVEDVVESFMDAKASVENEIEKSNSDLSSIIVNNLVNPNTAPGSSGGESGEVPEDTKLINDKTVSVIGYGFVKSGISMALVGVTGKGLGLGEDPSYNAEFEFMNPSNDLFSSYAVNDILKITASRAFICTNNGLVDFTITDGRYFPRYTSHGLNSNKVISCAAVRTKDSSQSGYIAGTDRGVNFSPNGERWVDIDPKFDNVVTCLSRTQLVSDKQTILFIGTATGLYFVDIDEYLKDGVSKVHSLKSISVTLPSTYINAVAYNTALDTLYVATDGGLAVIPNITAYIAAGEYETSDVCTSLINYTSKTGLANTYSMDVFLKTDSTVIVGNSSGLTITKDFVNFAYLTKKQGSALSSTAVLNGHMCKRILRKDATTITVLHTFGLTEGVTASI